jgi:hypothetical protein
MTSRLRIFALGFSIGFVAVFPVMIFEPSRHQYRAEREAKDRQQGDPHQRLPQGLAVAQAASSRAPSFS